MSTRCFLVDADDFEAQQRPGAVWQWPDSDLRDRAPLFVCLPDGKPWHVNREHGWAITGEPPNLTAMPSVDSGTYHGWLTDGVLSDDLAGRTYGDT